MRLSGDDSVRIPHVPGTSYEITVGNSSVSAETKYALGFGIDPGDSLFDSFTPSEENDVGSTIADSQTLNLNESHVEYLVTGDVDAYLLQF